MYKNVNKRIKTIPNNITYTGFKSGIYNSLSIILTTKEVIFNILHLHLTKISNN